MSKKIELEASRDFGDILNDTFILIRQNFKPLVKAYFVICGVFIFAGILTSTLSNLNNDDPLASFFYTVIELILSVFSSTAVQLTVLSYYVIYKEKGNNAPTVMEVWGYFRYYYFRVLTTQALIIITVVIGCFLCVIPGIYLAIVFSLVLPIMVVENGNLEYSFKKSLKLIKGNWWFTFGALILTLLLMTIFIFVLMIPAMVIYGGTRWLSGKDLNTVGGILQAIMLNLSNILSILPLSALTLVYFSIVDEKEGTTLRKRMQSFGSKHTDASNSITEEY